MDWLDAKLGRSRPNISRKMRLIRSTGGVEGLLFLLDPLSGSRRCLWQGAWKRHGRWGIGLQAAFDDSLLPLRFSRAGFGLGDLRVAIAFFFGLPPGRGKQTTGVLQESGQPLFPLFVTEAGCQLLKCGFPEFTSQEWFERVATGQGQLVGVEVTDYEQLPGTRGICLRCRIV